MMETLSSSPEQSSADRAYSAGDELVETLGRLRWISVKEFIDYIQDRANVDKSTAQMVFASFTSQVRVELSSVGVRSLAVDEGSFDNSSLDERSAKNAQIPYSQFWGGAHFDY